MRAWKLVLVLVVVLSLSGVARAAAPKTEITDLAVTRSGDTLTVSGSAVFADASNATIVTDVAGDQAVTGIGADLTATTITHDGPGRQLIFRFKIADPHATLFTIPEVVHYHWIVSVKNGDIENYYQLQAMRSGQYERTLPSADPLFRVNSCGALASGAPNCFEVASYVPGAMADGTVEWRVPMGVLGATKGTIIGPSRYGRINIVGGASAAAHGVPVFDDVKGCHVAQPVPDCVTISDYVVGRSVQMSFRAADDPAAIPTETALASVGADGTFVGKIDVPLFVDDRFEVVTTACWGDGTGCGMRTAPLPG